MNSTDTLKKNKKLIEDYFYKIWNNGELEILDQIISADYINHSPGVPNPPLGPLGLRPIIEAMRKGIPDLHYDIRDLIITEDRIVARVFMTGTQTHELWGIPPSGKCIAVNQMNIEYVKDGKIAEHWRVTDELLMMKQLGAL